MTVFALGTALTLFAALAILQILVAAGLPYGRLVWAASTAYCPGASASAASSRFPYT